jgi:hypothetical protein
MKKKTPHKHAELIKQWADDTSIKIQYESSPGRWVDASSPCWSEEYGYRIKTKVIRYRVALFNDNSCTTAEDEQQEKGLQNSAYFKKWLTDWIEVEI